MTDLLKLRNILKFKTKSNTKKHFYSSYIYTMTEYSWYTMHAWIELMYNDRFTLIAEIYLFLYQLYILKLYVSMVLIIINNHEWKVVKNRIAHSLNHFMMIYINYVTKFLWNFFAFLKLRFQHFTPLILLPLVNSI